MARSLFISSVQAGQPKSIVALELLRALRKRHQHVELFCPVVGQGDADPLLDQLLAQEADGASADLHLGVTYQDWHANQEAALAKILHRFQLLDQVSDAVLVIGSDYSDLPGACELAMNATIAATLASPVVLLLPGEQFIGPELAQSAQLAIATIQANHASVIGLVAAGLMPLELDQAEAELAGLNLPTAFVSDSTHNHLVRSLDSESHATQFDATPFLAAMDQFTSKVVTPTAFQATLLARAKANLKHIVLPEGEDDRVLQAAARVVELGAAEVSILGDAEAMGQRAADLGIDLGEAHLVDPNDPALIDRFATEFARIRASKGVTYEDAVKVFQGSKTYFGTMMVHLGLADGMVSGANNTTADTIRPAFQFIKTAPGVAIVSSAFLMALADKVMVFADCAVNPNPTPAQLADIAISSAKTAAAFGVEPKVALISYSTGTSGAGPDVAAVTEAVALAKQAAPDLVLDGPLQYDAAVVPAVAAAKRPGSAVAGQATVLIFPDLNTGNATYKAVQRSAGALAIGPVLQGLNKPVNDLSRGALVDDIVNTVIITACQAA
ncbi:MAG: phosphate acetyltransferase [Micrococcales bacterium]|nr:phosphate acetyltransferase [Micrococcales bacterium]